MKTPAKILIVEDESIVAFNLQQRLAQMGYEVPAVAASGSETLNLAQTILPDLVLMDIHIDGQMDGIETAHKIREFGPIPIIFISGYSSNELMARANAIDPVEIFVKPVRPQELQAAIEAAVQGKPCP